MAPLVTLSILGGCIAVSIALIIAMLVIALLGPPEKGASARLRVGRFVGALTAAMLVSTMTLVVFPRMLDPLCDDFDWFGANTAKTARSYAHVMKAPIGRLDR